jgi:hypothetical protein
VSRAQRWRGKRRAAHRCIYCSSDEYVARSRCSVCRAVLKFWNAMRRH